jgi:tRNA(Ile)-lysidine synthase
MNYIVAVSGGVDSVVLLDMLSKTQHKLIVAHVDHGIRGKESAADARFVAALARRYQLPFVSTELHLGAHASEETAREKRYEFLFGEAEKYRAVVVTAHHRDDIIETITLNLTRGTGWRGLAVLARKDIERPPLEMMSERVRIQLRLAHIE